MTIVEKQIDFSNWKIHVQSCVQKYWFFNININILEYWPWSWYWLLVLVNIDIGIDIGIQQDIDIDLDIDLDFSGGKLLISILILKKKFWKLLILILNKNFILSHLCTAPGPTASVMGSQSASAMAIGTGGSGNDSFQMFAFQTYCWVQGFG